MTDSGVRQILRRLADKPASTVSIRTCSVTPVPHTWRAQRSNDTDLMGIAGWCSPPMLCRYGASAADACAREANRHVSPGDRYRRRVIWDQYLSNWRVGEGRAWE